MCHTSLAIHIVVIHTSPSTHNTHLTMYICTHVQKDNRDVHIYTERERENNHQKTCIHIVDILIIAKFLLISTTTNTHCTLYTHIHRHTETVTINSGAYTPHPYSN